MTTDEMLAFHKAHGLAALLDHLGLDGLGNEVVALRAENQRLRDLPVLSSLCSAGPARDRAITAISGVLMRTYDSEFDAAHLTPANFRVEAAAALDALLTEMEADDE